jgi:exodeoxyribonuclease VII small subunit
MTKNNISFESALKELEKITEKLESPDITLSEALEYFEKGVLLLKKCDEHLKNAEGKLKELLKGENGELIEKICKVSINQNEIEDDE